MSAPSTRSAPVEGGVILDPSISRNPVEVEEPLNVDGVLLEAATETVEIGEPLEADLPSDVVFDDIGVEYVEIGEEIDVENPILWQEADSAPTEIGDRMDADATIVGESSDSEPIDIGPPLEVPDSLSSIGGR